MAELLDANCFDVGFDLIAALQALPFHCRGDLSAFVEPELLGSAFFELDWPSFWVGEWW